jgi:hypothetical protein
MAGWLDDVMAGWRDGWMAGWRDGGMAGWRNGWMAGELGRAWKELVFTTRDFTEEPEETHRKSQPG